MGCIIIKLGNTKTKKQIIQVAGKKTQVNFKLTKAKL